MHRTCQTRHALAASFGLAGAVLSVHDLWIAPHARSWPLEHYALAGCAALSLWCLAAAVHSLWSGGVVPRRSRNAATALMLLRALLCGGAVAWCGWSAALGRPHLGLMGAMQASASVAAWGACVTRAFEARGKSPTPDGDSAATPPRRAGSHTLPRGWRYHKSTGMFEHKRSGRLQRQPPATCETGSPLHADLPPCDEELGTAYHDDACAGGAHPYPYGGYEFDSGSGSEGSARSHSRSRTWAHGSRAEQHAARSCSSRASASRSASAMSVWELRKELAARGAPDGCDGRYTPRDAV